MYTKLKIIYDDYVYMIRHITPAVRDYQAYSDLIRQLASHFEPFSFEEYQNMWSDLQDDPNTEIYLLEDQGNIVGTIKILFERKWYGANRYVGHIEDVVVDQSVRGQGKGRQLMEYATQRCRDAGCYKVVLYCNSRNVAFYAKMGYKEDGSNLSYRFP